MVESNNITIEFTIQEAKILAHALSSFIPLKADELISFMLHNRVTHKIQEAVAKNESL